MIEWIRKLIVPTFEDDALNRRVFNLNVILFSTFVVMLLGIVAMLVQLGTRPLSYVLPNTLFISMAAGVLLICYALSRRGRVMAGSSIFVAMMTIACTGAVIVGGTQGALPVILIIPIAAAGTTLGGNAGLVMSIFSMIALITIGLLERNGLIQISYPPKEMVILLNMFDVGFSFFFVTLSIWLASYSLRISLRRVQDAADEASKYREELEHTLAEEEIARMRLERAFSEFGTFLDRIDRGEYDARLALGATDENLLVLQNQLNATVDTLVDALEQSETARQEMEAAQRRYLLQAWREYTSGAPTTDFEIAGSDREILQEQLLAALKIAVTKKQAVSRETEDEQLPTSALAVPIRLRDEVIGVLGIGREGNQRPWTSEERELVDAIVERLALSAERLRLMNETQQRAARERLVSDVSTQVRETLNIETILQTTVNELYERLGLEKVAVHLATDTDGGEEN